MKLMILMMMWWLCIYAAHLVSWDIREVVVEDQPGFRLRSHRAQRGERQGQRRPSNFPPVTSLLACIGRWKRNIKISVSVEVFLALWRRLRWTCRYLPCLGGRQSGLSIFFSLLLLNQAIFCVLLRLYFHFFSSENDRWDVCWGEPDRCHRHFGNE